MTVNPAGSEADELETDGQEPEDRGRDEDLVVGVDEQVFGSVVLGRTRFADAVSRGAIRRAGRPNLVRSFPSWLDGPRFAEYATRGVTPA